MFRPIKVAAFWVTGIILAQVLAPQSTDGFRSFFLDPLDSASDSWCPPWPRHHWGCTDQPTSFSWEAVERRIKIKEEIASRETSGLMVALPSVFLMWHVRVSHFLRNQHPYVRSPRFSEHIMGISSYSFPPAVTSSSLFFCTWPTSLGSLLALDWLRRHLKILFVPEMGPEIWVLP